MKFDGLQNIFKTPKRSDIGVKRENVIVEVVLKKMLDTECTATDNFKMTLDNVSGEFGSFCDAELCLSIFDSNWH